MRIRKSTGQYQPFDLRKYQRSLRKSGVPTVEISRLASLAAKRQAQLSSTNRLASFTEQQLARSHKKSAMRYGLRQAIMRLGPTGFPFEQFVARVLNHLGYQTQTGIFIRGYCVSHEVDILANKDGQRHFFECKFHNRRGIKTHIQTALYVKARFEDLDRGFRDRTDESRLAPKLNVSQAWLVTNTKCTSEAVKYAACSGINILSWGYPQNQGLERIIEKNKLYPVTVLMNLDNNLKTRLFNLGIITIQDLIKFTDWNSLNRQDANRIKQLRQQALIFK
ncbi:MAG: hypothetical protein V1853_04505 [bacterium]